MVFDVSKIGGIGDYTEKNEKVVEGSGKERSSGRGLDSGKERTLYFRGEKVFLVVNNNTIEVRTDEGLKKLLTEKYESVMESRYFGRGGVEIVMAGQLNEDELFDLVRLSYNLS